MDSGRQTTDRRRLSWPRRGLFLVAVFLILLSWWQVARGRAGLEALSLSAEGVPMTLIAPAGAENRPGIMIAHGFGGSQQLMLGYAYTLAHAGYAVLLWDFNGHAANPAPLTQEADALQGNLDAAYALFSARPEVDPGRIGLLGHSMGSGVVMSAAILDGQRYLGTVAVSPTGADVSTTLPQNLLLQAGELEPQFADNARRLLAQAGGENDDFASGRARAFQLIPSVEHITILFSAASHGQALDWLNTALTTGFGSGQYTDQRMVWYLLHLSGWLLAMIAVSPLMPKTLADEKRQTRPPWHIIGLAVAPFIGAALLWVVNQVLDVAQLGGVFVGGGFGLWALLWGACWLFIGFRPRPFPMKDFLWGLVLFMVLWLAFGALAQFTWLPWFLIPERLVRWPLFAAAFLPWMWAAGLAQQGAPAGKRVLWWLGQSFFLILGLLVLAWLVPGMGILFLVMPLMPLILGILSLAGAVFDRPGAYAIGSALFFGWMVLAYFPLG